MSFDYIHQTYGVRFRRGQRVACGENRVMGTVTKATHYVHVRADGHRHAERWHPSDVVPVEEHAVSRKAE